MARTEQTFSRKDSKPRLLESNWCSDNLKKQESKHGVHITDTQNSQVHFGAFQSFVFIKVI